MILYFDTSALVKRYVREPRSDEVTALFGQAQAVGSSVLAQVEMAFTLSKGIRMKWVEQEDANRAWSDFLLHWPSFTRLVVSGSVLDRAASLAWEYGLRGYDATHFASALAWQTAIATPVTLATFDRGLWNAAKKSGMEIWPPEL
jgi:hypothetical protein